MVGTGRQSRGRPRGEGAAGGSRCRRIRDILNFSGKEKKKHDINKQLLKFVNFIYNFFKIKIKLSNKKEKKLTQFPLDPDNG